MEKLKSSLPNMMLSLVLICVVAAVFVWRLVPETKGKTLEDMSKMWKDRLAK